MMNIVVKNNNVKKALSILKKKLHEDGLFKELRDREHFISNGERKRVAKRLARSRWLKKQQLLETQFEKKMALLARENSKRSRENKRK
jgi:small subunit ribosomal protein S21